ncbi:MAG TPA: SRPBCC family protein [Solirubrobacteraceae bacterium]|jgi:hypothetical protein
MATIRKQTTVDVSASRAWDAARDFGNLHERLVPGFVTDAHLDGDARVVTFGSGAVLRERLIARDDDARRLVWSIVDGPYEHHNGSLEVVERGPGQTEVVWTTDLLPDEAAGPTAAAMQEGIAVIKRTLEAPG